MYVIRCGPCGATCLSDFVLVTHALHSTTITSTPIGTPQNKGTSAQLSSDEVSTNIIKLCPCLSITRTAGLLMHAILLKDHMMHFPKGVCWGHLCASAPVGSRHTELDNICTALQVEASFLAAAAVSVGALQGQEYPSTLCGPCAGHVQALWRQPHTEMGQWPDAACLPLRRSLPKDQVQQHTTKPLAVQRRVDLSAAYAIDHPA